MGRIRTVKPELLTHEGLFELEEETGFPIRIAFVGLFTQADRNGCFKWRPRELKLGVLPYDLVDFSRVLDALATRGFIKKYSVSGVDYGIICTFTDHQVINNRESESGIPLPSENDSTPDDTGDVTRDSRVNDACSTPLVQVQGEGKGRERKGKEGNKDSPSESPPKKKSKWKFEIHHHELSVKLSNPVMKKFPNQKINLDEWADAVRKLIEIDGKTEDEILGLWYWIRDHQGRNGFSWGNNILTPMKLRKRDGEGVTYFDKTQNQMIQEKSYASSSQPNQQDRKKSLQQRALDQSQQLRAYAASGGNTGEVLDADDSDFRTLVGEQ